MDTGVLMSTEGMLGFPLFSKGKVRDTYVLSDGLLFMVATDRISAFDVVLPTGIPDKGLVLNWMSGFWFKKTRHLVENHFVDFADAPHVPIIYRQFQVLANLPPQIARQAMIVKKAQRIDIECIVRGYLAGSAWAEYRRNGTVWGQELPRGFKEGQVLPEPLFTPTTKAEVGHDQNMTHQQVVDMVGEDLSWQLKEKSIAVYNFAREYALQCGIIVADTKMEFGLLDGKLILIDELLTPDSSRFWDVKGYEPGKSQPNFDKQYVRDWLDFQGWNHEPPAPELPKDVVEKTSQRYQNAYYRLTGKRIT